MKINLAKSAGFCTGVKRALQIARQTTESQAKVYMLGDIVHNEDVVREIRKSGIKKIKQLSKGKNKTLLIRAHGASRKTCEKARKLGYKVIDATCSMVKEIHKIAKNWEQKGYRIIIIGNKKHDEVRGIVGQLKKKAMIIKSLKHIPAKETHKIKQATVVVQSTQNIERVLEIVAALRGHIKRLKFVNTICRPTRIKQEEIRTMSLENDVMIIIGSKTSANTKRLYEISKSLNERSYWVQSKKDIKPKWLQNVKNVGVMAGASTPNSTTISVINQIRYYS